MYRRSHLSNINHCCDCEFMTNINLFHLKHLLQKNTLNPLLSSLKSDLVITKEHQPWPTTNIMTHGLTDVMPL